MAAVFTALRYALPIAVASAMHTPLVAMNPERNNFQVAPEPAYLNEPEPVSAAAFVEEAAAYVEEAEDHPQSILKMRNSTEAMPALVVAELHELGMHSTTTDDYNPWKAIYKARRHHWHDEYAKKGSPEQFIQAASLRDWLAFFASLPVLIVLQIYMSKRTRTIRHHVYALLIWLAVGAAALGYIRFSIGSEEAIHWITGYVLEFIFTIENVFVFHMVVKGFHADKRSTKTALFYVVLFQIVCGAIFYMGLAHTLRSMHFLPYVLGLWLLYIGICAAIEDGHDELNAEETSVYKFVEWFLGDTLSPQFAEDGAIFFTKNGKTAISMVGPVIFCLLIVDFMLEIDVTLTKIEELDNEYVAFTSSAIAAFAMPEIYFVAQDLFQRYSLLKYGISFVIVFFGVQMLGHRFFSIPDLLGCAIMIGAMLLCVLLSACFGYGSTPDYEKKESEDARLPRQ